MLISMLVIGSLGGGYIRGAIRSEEIEKDQSQPEEDERGQQKEEDVVGFVLLFHEKYHN